MQLVVPEAVLYWEDVLTVINRGDTIRVSRKCRNNQYFLAPGDTTQYCKESCVRTTCGEYKVPDSHLEVGGGVPGVPGGLLFFRAATPATPTAATARRSRSRGEVWREQTLCCTSRPSLLPRYLVAPVACS